MSDGTLSRLYVAARATEVNNLKEANVYEWAKLSDKPEHKRLTMSMLILAQGQHGHGRPREGQGTMRGQGKQE